MSTRRVYKPTSIAWTKQYETHSGNLKKTDTQCSGRTARNAKFWRSFSSWIGSVPRRLTRRIARIVDAFQHAGLGIHHDRGDVAHRMHVADFVAHRFQRGLHGRRECAGFREDFVG